MLASENPAPVWHEMRTCMRTLNKLAAFIVILTLLAVSSLRAEDAAAPLEEPYATWEHTAKVAQDVLEERKASTDALEQLRLAAPVVEDQALVDPRALGDDARAQRLDSTLLEDGLRRVEQRLRALGPSFVRPRLHFRFDHAVKTM